MLGFQRQRQIDLLRFRLLSGRGFDGGANQLVDGHHLADHVQLAAIDAGEIEQIVDEPSLQLDISPHDAQRRARFRRDRRIVLAALPVGRQ